MANGLADNTMEESTEVWEGWHFLPEDGCLWWSGGWDGVKRIKVEAGVTYHIGDDPVTCQHGLHASRLPLDALDCAPPTDGLIVCRVRLGGTIIESDGRASAAQRTVLWMADATRTIHEFAIWCAEQALKEAHITDERSWNALATKRAWLDGKATDTELFAARTDAEDAILAARTAAKPTAQIAAMAAFQAAVTEPDQAAIWAANWAAAVAPIESVARDAQNAELERRLMELAPMVNVTEFFSQEYDTRKRDKEQ